MTLQQLVVLLCVCCILSQRAQAAWFVERVYSDPACMSLATTNLYEVGRCTYIENGGYSVYLRTMDALIVHNCYDNDCKNCSFGTEVDVSADCNSKGDGSHKYSLITNFPDTTNSTITVTYRDYNCIGPIGKFTISPGCIANPLLYVTCTGYTQFFCEKPSIPNTSPILPLFPTSHQFNGLLPSYFSHSLQLQHSTRNQIRELSPILWFFVYYYSQNNTCNTSTMNSAVGYPINTCIVDPPSNSSYYYRYFGDTSYVTRYTCVGTCDECPQNTKITPTPCNGLGVGYSVHIGYPDFGTLGNTTVRYSSKTCRNLSYAYYRPLALCDVEYTGYCQLDWDWTTYHNYCGTPSEDDFVRESQPNTTTSTVDSTVATSTSTTTSYATTGTSNVAKWVFQEKRSNCKNVSSVESAIAWVVNQCRPDGQGGAAMIVEGDDNSVVLFNCLWANCSYCPVSSIVKLNECQQMDSGFTITTMYSGVPDYLSYGAVEVFYSESTCMSSSFDHISIRPKCLNTTNICKQIPFTSTYYTDYCGLPSFINPVPPVTTSTTTYATTASTTYRPATSGTSGATSSTAMSTSSATTTTFSTSSSTSRPSPAPTSVPNPAPTSSPAPNNTFSQGGWVLRNVHMDKTCTHGLLIQAVGVPVGKCTIQDDPTQPPYYSYVLGDTFTTDGIIYSKICTDSYCRNCITYTTINTAMCFQSQDGNYSTYQVIDTLPSWLGQNSQAYVQYSDPQCSMPSKYTIEIGCDAYSVYSCQPINAFSSRNAMCTPYSPFFPYNATTFPTRPPTPRPTLSPTVRPPNITTGNVTTTTSRTTTTITTATTKSATSYSPSSTSTTGSNINLCPCPHPSTSSRTPPSLSLPFFSLLFIFVWLLVT